MRVTGKTMHSRRRQPTKLEFFRQLPPEFRRIIWELCIHDIPRRVVEFNVQATTPMTELIAHPTSGSMRGVLPALLSACHENRELALQYYVQCLNLSTAKTPGHTTIYDAVNIPTLEGTAGDAQFYTRFKLDRDYMWLQVVGRCRKPLNPMQYFHVPQIVDNNRCHSRAKILSHERPCLGQHSFRA